MAMIHRYTVSNSLINLWQFVTCQLFSGGGEELSVCCLDGPCLDGGVVLRTAFQTTAVNAY